MRSGLGAWAWPTTCSFALLTARSCEAGAGASRLWAPLLLGQGTWVHGHSPQAKALTAWHRNVMVWSHVAGGSKKRRKEFCRPSSRRLLCPPGGRARGQAAGGRTKRALFQAQAGRSSSQRPAPPGSASSSVSRRGTSLEHPLPGASTVAAPGPSPGSGKSFKNTF